VISVHASAGQLLDANGATWYGVHRKPAATQQGHADQWFTLRGEYPYRALSTVPDNRRSVNAGFDGTAVCEHGHTPTHERQR
jgi:hypothetical protein